MIGRGSIRTAVGAALALAIALGVAAPALADFPYARPGADEADYSDLYITDQVPNDVGDDSGGEYFKYAASPLPGNAINDGLPAELGGIRGARIFDRNASLPTAWQLTTGRPDVTIATLDSGIKWDDPGAMNDLRLKTRINKGEVPLPEGCGAYDCNGDHVFNVADYASDSRVRAVVDGPDPRRNGPNGVLTPQDVLIAFSDGVDDDGNGYLDDMVGWDYLDNDNDPFDDVSYGHGTGEAEGSSAELDNGNTTGTCPNCMVIHMRVGDSFVADVNRFAAAVTYAADNDVQVVQSALGTLNNTSLAREAVEYAYRHGTTMVVSAADEAAQHNNQPALPHTILVNSVTRSPVPAPDQSFLAFNGCTNFSAKITLAIESTSCSSDAVGLASGMAGLVYSAAYNALESGKLGRHPDPGACETVEGERCVVTPNEVRQLMASGRIPGIAGGQQTDDVNFLSPTGGPEPSCTPVPLPECTGPYGAGNGSKVLLNTFRPSLLGGPVVSESYPARRGTDQFYGYGRANTRAATEALLPSTGGSKVPPEAEIRSPEWFEQVDPSQAEFAVTGDVFARGADYVCDVLVAPGQYPNQRLASDGGAMGSGDFRSVGNGWCDGTTVHSHADAGEARSGILAEVDVATLKSYFPAATDFEGPQPEASTATNNGRPAMAPNSFTFKVVVQSEGVSGEDQRSAYLHRDRDLLPGFPRTISEPEEDGAVDFPTGDGESSPAFADLDGDNRNELLYASSDGFVHALSYDPQTGSAQELAGWPVRGDSPSYIAAHQGAPAFAGGGVGQDYGGAFLAALAVGDANSDGLPEVYAADLEGLVYGWDHRGRRIFTEGSNPDYSGAPRDPFVRVRRGKTNRTQPGFIGSPVLADLDDDGDEELVAASMDRHVYAWDTADSDPRARGGASAVDGFPTLVVDTEKVESIDPVTHAVRFRADSGSQQQGGIIDTPAIVDLDADANDEGPDERPEIVVGTNEGYAGGDEPPPNTSVFTNPSFGIAEGSGLIEPGNTRLYALDARGDQDGDPATPDAQLDGWPVSLAFLNAELLPVVGEGVTGSPVVAPASCPNGGSGPKVGAISYAGPGYILNPDGSSCYGNGADGTYNTLATDQGLSGEAVDRPAIPAVGHPAFGDLLGTGDPSFVVPAAGLQRALDLVLPEYQPAGQDYMAAYDVSTGQFRPNFPQTQNDLSFLTGPSIADVDGLPGEESVSGSASMDLNAYTSAGVSVPGWPKLSSDWVVANPLIGSFGTLDTDSDARKAVIGMTRSGYLLGYETSAPACSPGSWPRFHHDNANSGDYERDAVAPGRPADLELADGRLTFVAPGDDLLCGRVARYEMVTSAHPIGESGFDSATELDDAPDPTEPGSPQQFDRPAGARRYIAIRAVDEQGNVGRVAELRLPPLEPCVNPINGTAGADVLTGTAAADLIRAFGGGDEVDALAGGDCVYPGGGDDVVRAGDGDDTVNGGAGLDRLAGDRGDDSMIGGDGPDVLGGGLGDDTINAADGVGDRIDCGPGNDVVAADRFDRAQNCESTRRTG